MDKDQRVAGKALLYTLLTILFGYALLAIPFVSFLVECIVVFVVFTYLYDAYSFIVYENETKKEIEKTDKDSSKKKGKK